MNRRTFMCGVSAVVASASIASPHLLKQQKRPHILFLFTDQQRGDWMGCMGDKHAITPHIDALAADGTLFTQGYSCTPTCTPARACLLTGQDPWHNGMVGYGAIPKSFPNDFPTLLTKAGYMTACFGKQHFGEAPHGYQHECLYDGLDEVVDAYRLWMRKHYPAADESSKGLGWNVWRGEIWKLPEDAHPTRWIVDRTIEWLDGYKEDKPFMVKVSFHRPHAPYDPPKRWFDAFNGKDLPPPDVGDWAKIHEGKNPQRNRNASAGKMPAKEAAFSRQAYRASVGYIDEQIGRLVADLKKRGIYENTLIVLSADHGDMLGDNNLWRKAYPYQGSVRVPMVVRVPASMGKTQRGAVCHKPVELRDIAPTFLNTAGVTSTPEPMQGRSMITLAKNVNAPWREWIDLEHSVCYAKWNQWTALTDGKEKYIFYAPNGTEQFFDLVKDPTECHELSQNAEYQERIAVWRQRMVDHLAIRGPAYVKDGKLQKRVANVVYRTGHINQYKKQGIPFQWPPDSYKQESPVS